MKKKSRLFSLLLVSVVAGLMVSSFRPGSDTTIKFPYQKAVLSDREDVAHLLNRFSFGATPGQIDMVVKMGVEKWFAEQLDMKAKDDSLAAFLSRNESLSMSNEQIAETFPRPAQVLNRAIRAGVVDRDSVKDLG